MITRITKETNLAKFKEKHLQILEDVRRERNRFENEATAAKMREQVMKKEVQMLTNEISRYERSMENTDEFKKHIGSILSSYHENTKGLVQKLMTGNTATEVRNLTGINARMTDILENLKNKVTEVSEDQKTTLARVATIHKHITPNLTTSNPSQLRMVICMTGQLSRLELKSKIKNVIGNNKLKGHHIDVVVILDASNVTKYSDEAGGMKVDPSLKPEFETEESVRRELAPYTDKVRIKWYTQPADPVVAEWYYDGMYDYNYPKDPIERSKRVKLHVRQYATIEQCYDQILELELDNGIRYDEIVRLREDAFLFTPIRPLHELYKDSEGPMPDMITNECENWNGINDKGALVKRSAAETYFRGPMRAMYVDKGSIDSSQLRNGEGFIRAVFQDEGKLNIVQNLELFAVAPLRPACAMGGHPCLKVLREQCFEKVIEEFPFPLCQFFDVTQKEISSGIEGAGKLHYKRGASKELRQINANG